MKYNPILMLEYFFMFRIYVEYDTQALVYWAENRLDR